MQFGWISTAELITRLEATLGTTEQLPKNDGHLFNWYETRTLEVLSPAYVSTVDSGNLAGHLLTLAQACRQFRRCTVQAAKMRKSVRSRQLHCGALPSAVLACLKI